MNAPPSCRVRACCICISELPLMHRFTLQWSADSGDGVVIMPRVFSDVCVYFGFGWVGEICGSWKLTHSSADLTTTLLLVRCENQQHRRGRKWAVWHNLFLMFMLFFRNSWIRNWIHERQKGVSWDSSVEPVQEELFSVPFYLFMIIIRICMSCTQNV